MEYALPCSMHKWPANVQWKYLRIEILFFVIFYYLFPVLTDIEYSFNEMHHAALFTKNIPFDLVYGTFSIPGALVFYFIVRKFMFSKRLPLFFLLVALYLVGYHYYKSGVYYLVGHSGWFPDDLEKSALRWYKSDSIHFSVIYMFREFLCIGALAYFIRSAKQDTQMRELKEQQLLTELNYLKAQLHPHFFFNTMNNIYALALKRSEATAPLVAKLADMMRYILYEADLIKVPLSREVQFLTDYIDAEKIRHHNSNQISFDVQGITAHAIQPLLLLPFIENAFKHGLHEETGNGFVNIVLCMTDAELILQVTNSKPAVNSAGLKGIGLQNAVKRLNLLYPGKYVLDIKEDEHQYNLNLSLQNR
jgi:two-component system LytT family sensor kinase